MTNRTPQIGRSRRDAGFTLVEAVVTMVAFSFIMVVAFQLFTRLGGVALSNDQVARSQAGARVAIEEIERYLRSAGAEVDLGRGQRNFVFAGPFQLAFNANVLPANDPAGTLAPAALVAGAPGSGVPSDGSSFYTPPMTFQTGAETIVFTLDSTLDGAISAADKADDLEERSTNPNDYVLYRNVYGFDGNANSVDRNPIAVLRGPEPSEAGDFIPPLFTYWIDDDDDRTTPPVLFGDANGDGRISAGESALITPLGPRDLARVERVGVTVTSETASPDKARTEFGGYERVAMSTEVKIRQVPRSTGMVFGVVFKDLDGDGTKAPNESPIGGVLIQASTGQQTRTSSDGTYLLAVTPGVVTITEVDPTGYSSSTQNVVQIDAYPGSYTQVNFGDTPSSGLGVVRGVVFADKDQDQEWDADERRISNVKIYSDTGEYTLTRGDGSFRLDVPVGIRTISQVDSTGYTSTTPNTVDVNVERAGVEYEVNFGDMLVGESGTIQGYVFNDTNGNGLRDNRESGVHGAIITAGAGLTETDPQGFFSLTVPTGNYSVFEQDPPGYSSTTPNRINGVRVDRDQVVTVYFGDIVQEDVDFEVIELADTEKALSLASGDLKEDNRGDKDLILGTRFAGGVNNLLVWHNNRRNSSTPNSAIFDATPSFTRANPADVTSLLGIDINGDRRLDLVTGLASELVPDVNVWMNNNGTLPNAPTWSTHVYNGRTVFDLQYVDINADGRPDVVAAVSQGPTSGHAEILFADANGGFTGRTPIKIGYRAEPSFSPISSVTAARAADLNRDGLKDLVLASVESTYYSTINVYLQKRIGDLIEFIPWQIFPVQGQITHVRLADLVEDGDGDVDIVIATALSETTGGIEIWHGYADGRFGFVSESARIRDDFMVTGGAPLSLVVTRLDNDIFPDTVIGTRRGSSYEGTVEYALGFGHLSAESTPITDFSIGAVLTMTEDDFNSDGVSDLAVGTQNSSSRGKLFVFFRQ